MNYIFRFSLLLFCLVGVTNSTIDAKSFYPPPVEKVKPPVEKKKVKKKLKMKFKKKLQRRFNKLQQTKQSYIDGGMIATVFSILFALLAVTGLFFFGLGIVGPAAIIWILGLYFLGASNLVGLIGVILFAFNPDREGGSAMLFLSVILILVNLIGGLVFLIGGLIAMTPVTWILGLALLFLLCIFVALFLVGLNNSTIG